MPRFNDFPHPRILFENVPDELLTQMNPLAAHWTSIWEDEEVELSEYDVLVTFSETIMSIKPGLHVLSFGADRIGSRNRNESSVANELSVAEGSPFSTLAVESLAPNLPIGEPKAGWGPDVMLEFLKTMRGPGAEPLRSHQTMTPLVTVGKKLVAAGVITELPDQGTPDAYRYPTLCVLLPEQTTEHARWLAELLRVLHGLDREHFPGLPAWQEAEKWSSASTAGLMAQLDALQEERRRREEEYAKRELELLAEIEAARAIDRDGVQRLLTANSEELCGAVADAISVLGFSVHEMDAHHQAGHGSRLEDLRVTTDDASQWTALVKVKGYTRGASVNDLQQVMGRPSREFSTESGMPPSALWQVVNVQRGDDPDIRRRAIDNDADLDYFADANGVLIDTRDLFQAVRGIQSGAAEAADVRGSLLTAQRRWTWPRQG